MDHIIFEDPPKRVSRPKTVGSNVALSPIRCDKPIKQALTSSDSYFSYSANFDIHFSSKDPVSLYDMFSLSGDEELGNEDLINGSLQTFSLMDTYRQQE